MRTLARYCLGATLTVALVVAVSAPTTAASPAVHPLVGAYYYLWNPENFAGGTLRAHLVPPQQPAASLVNSQSQRTASRDITNARQAGINFFAMDWWPYAPHSSPRIAEQANAMKAFLKAPNISRIRFAMFYETWNLGFDAGRESTPVTFAMELHFDADMASFAKDYFHNPSYLRIDGRPVVFLYLTRTLTGDVAGMIQGARTVLGGSASTRSSSGTRSTGASPRRTPTLPARSSRPRRRSTASSSSTPSPRTSSITAIPIGCSARPGTSRGTRGRRTSSPTNVT